MLGGVGQIGKRSVVIGIRFQGGIDASDGKLPEDDGQAGAGFHGAAEFQIVRPVDRIPEPRGGFWVGGFAFVAGVEAVFVHRNEIGTVSQHSRFHVVVGDSGGLLLDVRAALGDAAFVGDPQQALDADGRGPASGRGGPEVELPAEIRIREIFVDGVVNGFDQAADGIGKNRILRAVEHSGIVNRAGPGGQRGWVLPVLRQIAEEIGFQHDADHLVSRFGAGEIKGELQVGKVSLHVSGVLHMFDIGGVALPAVGNVVKYEERNHSELQAFPDE